MSKAPSSMTIMFEHQEIIEMLSDDEAGIVFKALFEYCQTGNAKDIQDCDRSVKMAFSVITRQLDRSISQYKTLCEKNSAAAKQRWDSTSSESERIEENTDVCTRISGDTQKCECINPDTKGIECIDNNAKNANSNPNPNCNPNPNPNCNPKEEAKKGKDEPCGSAHSPPSKSKPIRHKHGEYGHVLLTEEQYSKLIADFGESTIAEFIRKADEYVQMHGKTYRDYNLTIRNWISKDGVQRISAANELSDNSPSYDLNLMMKQDMKL